MVVELLQSGGDKFVSTILHLFTSCWEGKPIPLDWVNGVLVTLLNSRSEKSECDNYPAQFSIKGLCHIGRWRRRSRNNWHLLPLSRFGQYRDPLWSCWESFSLSITQSSEFLYLSSYQPWSPCGFRKGRRTRNSIFSIRQIHEKWPIISSYSLLKAFLG